MLRSVPEVHQHVAGTLSKQPTTATHQPLQQKSFRTEEMDIIGFEVGGVCVYGWWKGGGGRGRKGEE